MTANHAAGSKTKNLAYHDARQCTPMDAPMPRYPVNALPLPDLLACADALRAQSIARRLSRYAPARVGVGLVTRQAEIEPAQASQPATMAQERRSPFCRMGPHPRHPASGAYHAPHKLP